MVDLIGLFIIYVIIVDFLWVMVYIGAKEDEKSIINILIFGCKQAFGFVLASIPSLIVNIPILIVLYFLYPPIEKVYNYIYNLFSSKFLRIQEYILKLLIAVKETKEK